MMERILIWLLAAVFFTFSRPLYAGETEGTLDLKRSIEIALEKNFSILSAKEGIEGAERTKKAAFTDFFPKLSAKYNHVYLSKTPTSQTGGTPEIPIFADVNDPTSQIGAIPATPEREVEIGNQIYWDVMGTVTQPLFVGGRIYNSYRLAKLGVDLARVDVDRVKQDLSLRVVEAYFGILTAIELKKVADQAVRQLENQLEVSREFFNVGMIPKNDVLQVEVELASVLQRQTTAANGIEVAKSRLNTLLRRGVQKEVKVENLLTYEPIPFKLDESIQRALRDRVELKEIDLQIDSGNKRVSLTKSNYSPRAALSYTYFKSEGRSFQALEDGWNVVASAEWDFWEWGKTRQEVLAAKSDVRRLLLAKNELKDQFALEVKEAYLTVRETEKNIFVAKNAIEQAEENFRMNEERYKEQVGTLTDLLIARTLQTEAQVDYFTAIGRYNVAKARLRKAMGAVVYE
jgi:outer membrane protein TolC